MQNNVVSFVTSHLDAVIFAGRTPSQSPPGDGSQGDTVSGRLAVDIKGILAAPPKLPPPEIRA